MAVMSAATLFASGCESLKYMDPRQKNLEPCLAACARLGVTPTKYILTVSIARQTSYLFEDGKFVKSYRCSTSRFGIGQMNGSNCTPLGLHCIAEKIGDGEPAGTIFKDRQVIGRVSELGIKAGGITTRILWLEGLEPGYNQGGKVDTHDRYIYIHGTGDQDSIGRPNSHGCIHFSDEDLIELYNLLPGGTLVWISEN